MGKVIYILDWLRTHNLQAFGREELIRRCHQYEGGPVTTQPELSQDVKRVIQEAKDARKTRKVNK